LISPDDVVFLAHYIGGGIDAVLDLDSNDFFQYLDAAWEFYKIEVERPVRAILAGVEKGKSKS